MVRGSSSTDGVARFRKAMKGHHPYPYESTLSKSVLVENSKTEDLEEDRISKFPDEILVTILSLMTIKEAGRSSVLSRRWRYLWTFFSGKLDIGYKDNGTRDREDRLLTEMFEMLEKYQHSFKYKRDQLGIDELNKGLKILKDRLEIPVSGSRVVKNINAVLKSHNALFLDELRIHFSYLEKYSRDVDSWVKFASRKGIGSFELDLEPEPNKFDNSYKLRRGNRLFANSNRGHSNFCSLTCLQLRYVDVSGEILEHFLANCHFLKQLRVIHSMALVELNVTGPSLKLELDIQYTYGKDLMFYVSLVKACPFLYRLAMRYIYEEKNPSIGEGEELCLVREREKRLETTDKSPVLVTAEFQHLSLKVVELVGFIGYESDLELVFSLVEIAVSLEKLVIKPCQYYPGESRRRARKLGQNLPSSVNLLVL